MTEEEKDGILHSESSTQRPDLRLSHLRVSEFHAAAANLGARARYGRVQPALEDMVAEKRLICLPADDRVPRSCGRGAGRKREQE